MVLDNLGQRPYFGRVPKSRTSPEPEITVAESAAILRVDRKTILRLIAAGRLSPTRKLPTRTGAYLFDRADVERIAAERKAS